MSGSIGESFQIFKKIQYNKIDEKINMTIESQVQEKTNEELEEIKKECSIYNVQALVANYDADDLKTVKNISRAIFKIVNSEIKKRNEAN